MMGSISSRTCTWQMFAVLLVTLFAIDPVSGHTDPQSGSRRSARTVIHRRNDAVCNSNINVKHCGRSLPSSSEQSASISRRKLVTNALSCRQEDLFAVNARSSGNAGLARKPPPNEKSTSRRQSSSNSLRITLLILMVLQNSATVLVGRHTRSRSPDELFEISSFIIACEASKLLLSCFFEFIHSGGHLIQSIRQNIFTSKESLLILVPTLLYLIQNSLLHVALSHLSAPVFQVTYQFKLVTTALASVLFLERKYSPKQWVCLLSLGAGVATVVLGERVTVLKEAVTPDTNTQVGLEASSNIQSIALGLAAVCTACISSALASVSLERMLKGTSSTEKKKGKEKNNADAKTLSSQKKQPSLWLRNIELATFSLVVATIRRQHSLYGRSSEEIKPFFHNFSGWVYVLLGLQAGGGLLVAAVMKYADNVLKGLATGVSVVVSSVGSAVLFGTPINTYFSVGAATILCSVYLFSNDFPMRKI